MKSQLTIASSILCFIHLFFNRRQKAMEKLKVTNLEIPGKLPRKYKLDFQRLVFDFFLFKI